jgi:hypothetical protein
MYIYTHTHIIYRYVYYVWMHVCMYVRLQLEKGSTPPPHTHTIDMLVCSNQGKKSRTVKTQIKRLLGSIPGEDIFCKSIWNRHHNQNILFWREDCNGQKHEKMVLYICTVKNDGSGTQIRKSCLFGPGNYRNSITLLFCEVIKAICLKWFSSAKNNSVWKQRVTLLRKWNVSEWVA